MTICWVLVQTLLWLALWMIKGSVCIENNSPQEARRGINKQTSTDPFSTQFGPFLISPNTQSGKELVRHYNAHNSPALQNCHAPNCSTANLQVWNSVWRVAQWNDSVLCLDLVFILSFLVKPTLPSSAYVYGLPQLLWKSI